MARFNNLESWLAWLETLHPCEIDLGLKRVFSVAYRLGIIEPTSHATFTGNAVNANGRKPHVITIAGTNGKGSCVKTLESIILASSEYHSASRSSLSDTVFVSAFTSPHILHYSERIKLNGAPLFDIDICALFTAIDQARGDISLTYFEFAALAALLAMHRSNSPIWVLEVGLGGRLDAVNVVNCSVAVITSIGLDHQAWLGDTVEEIAREKGGIMRVNTPVIFGSQNMPSVLNQAACALNAKSYQQGKDYLIHTQDAARHVIKINNNDYIYSNFGLPIESIAAAIMACNILNLPLQLEATQQALNDLCLEGRFEIIRHRNAIFILDVAHNMMATQHFAQNLLSYKNSTHYHSEEVTAICGMMADKDISESLTPLASIISNWICCDIPNNTRAESADNLAQIVKNITPLSGSIITKKSVTKAVESIIDQQYHQEEPTRLTIYPIFGSFFTVSAAKIALRGKK